MMPLLEGLDGVNKMSKSLGNYIGINEPPQEIFGKLMSISDELMWRYYELLSFRSLGEIAGLKQQMGEGRNPRDIKVELALEIVARFHSENAAQGALADFETRFQRGAQPDEMPELTIAVPAEGIAIASLLKAANLMASTSEAMRMIEQGGVRADGERIEDKSLKLHVGTTVVLQVGKRKFARVILTT